MIYTVTFNPSLDYVIQVDKLVPGEINRTTHEAVYPGGKGNNVSVILSNLGHSSKALGFTAGFTGEALENMLKEFGCDTAFIRLPEGSTRINVKINAGEETEINGQGPVITEEAQSALFEQLDALKEEDILVLAGSIPNTLPSDIYERILEHLQGRGIHFVVDATKELLLKVLKYHPFLIKPNNHELGEMFGVTLKTRDEIVTYAKKLQEMGAENVLISMAGEGAVLIAANGQVYKKPVPTGTLVNGVGAGDSMVAGFMAGWMEKRDYRHAFYMGIAAGSASAFSENLATGKEVEAVYRQVAGQKQEGENI